MPAFQGTAAAGKVERARVPLRERFKAWWEGYDLGDVLAGSGEPRSQTASKTESKADGRVFTPFEPFGDVHLDLIQSVWGEGLVSPGSPEFLLYLVKPLGLSPAMSLLDFGAGLGGTARLVVDRFGVWVTGLERNPRFVEAGKELSKTAGMEKKAALVAVDLEAPNFGGRSYDCFFSKETLFTIPDKTALFAAIEESTKETGQILFTDFVIEEQGKQSEAIAAWAASEPLKPHLWSAADYESMLAKHNFEVRIAEDITKEYHDMIIRAWADYTARTEGKPVNRAVAHALVEEIELWTRRVQALDSGQLWVYRFFAMKRPSKRYAASI